MRDVSEAEGQGKPHCCWRYPSADITLFGEDYGLLIPALSQCNAARPCSYCQSAGINCVYSTSSASETHAQALKRKYSEAHERESTFRQIWEHIRDRPLSEADEILRRIREGAQPEAILSYIREGDLLLQLAVTPETRYRYVFPFV